MVPPLSLCGRLRGGWWWWGLVLWASVYVFGPSSSCLVCCWALCASPVPGQQPPLSRASGGISPLELGYILRGGTVPVLLKRDDKLRLDGSGVSGNKARKLWKLNNTPPSELPDLIVSHGGPQSNSMVALAAVAASKGKKFRYYCKTIPRWLRKNPSGNLARALALGTEIVEMHLDDYRRIFSGPRGPAISETPGIFEGEQLWCADALWIPQGGAEPGASEGIEMLGDEIIEHWMMLRESDPSLKRLNVLLPTGTGTTSLFLAHHLGRRRRKEEDILVISAPCLGDKSYLERQMNYLAEQGGLSSQSLGSNCHRILEPSHKEGFGVPRKELLDIWRDLKGNGMFVDLLYAPRAWEIIYEALDSGEVQCSSDTLLMYIHTGGVEGVSSQLTRYKHAGLADDFAE